MVWVCKGICKRIENTHGTNKYSYNGNRLRCKACDRWFVKTEDMGKWCPCCGSPLRAKPRHGRKKHVLVATAKRY